MYEGLLCETKKEWEESHPGEKYQMNWNLSLDYIAGEATGDDYFIGFVCFAPSDIRSMVCFHSYI